jgi:hypothetical protein
MELETEFLGTISLINTQRVEHLKGLPLALLTNIRQVWKGLTGTNTLAYYKHS